MSSRFRIFNTIAALMGISVSFFLSCTSKTDSFVTEPLSTYFPLQVGKYITYRLDSTVFVSFGSTKEIHSYEVKYVTDARITDNLGREAYRIIRFIRPDAGSAWTPDATFMAVNNITEAEFIENNLRYIKLKLPIRNGNSWKGNSFIDTYSVNSPVRYLDGWDYTYDSVGAPLQIGTLAFSNTLIVRQRDEVIGDPEDPNAYSEINTGIERYAAGVGMIYRKFFHSEYQPGGGFFADGSYGVEYTVIDHN